MSRRPLTLLLALALGGALAVAQEADPVRREAPEPAKDSTPDEGAPSATPTPTEPATPPGTPPAKAPDAKPTSPEAADAKTPDDAPGPDEDQSVNVEHPDELKRIEASLHRIQSVREDFQGKGKAASVRDQPVEFKSKELSPQLAPREEVVGLTLRQAIEAALTTNPDYLVALLDARAAAEGVPQARAAFDPTVSFTGTWTEARSPFFSTNPFTGFAPGLSVASSRTLGLQTRISQLLPTGTQLSLSYNEARQRTENVFSLNPSYQPSLSVNVTQPLLRGFGVDVNLAALRNARGVARQSEAALADTYMQAALAIERSYWDLILNEEQLRSQKQGLDSALRLLRDTRKLRKFGYAIPLDVTIAKAGVASRREGVIVAESNLEAARDQMVRLTRPSSDSSKWNVLIVPVDQPILVEEPTLSAVDAIQLALKRRPDYYRARIALENARRDVLVAENSVLPSVNLIAGWTQEGLGGQHHSSWSALGSGRFYTWSAGVSVELPLILRSERAALRQSKVTLERSEVALRTIEANVVLDVRAALRDIRTAKARIEAARASRILARKRLDATRKRVENGAAVPRDVLDDTAAVADAETAEIRAYVNYRLAVSSLKVATGTLLDDWLELLDPRVKRVLERKNEE